MWTEREREELSVWADELQSRGEGLGELIASSLLLESRFGADAADLRARVAVLEQQICAPMVAEATAGCPAIDPSWEHGMLVALRVVDHPLGRRLEQRALDSLRKLLSLPVARFLRHLRVDARELDWTPIHREVPAMLTEPGVVARPWSVVLGAPPRHMRRRSPLAVLDFNAAALADPERGLRSLFLDTVRVELPWHRGDKGTRQRAVASLGNAGRLVEPSNLTRIARALWDPSVRVRLRVLNTIPLLGVDAAALVPELLLVERGQLEWVIRVREVLGILARNPSIVGSVANNFTVDQTRCAGWLATSPLAVARAAIPRIEAMLASSLGPRALEGWARRELEDARRRLDYRAEVQREALTFDARTAAGQPLLRRLRRWFG